MEEGCGDGRSQMDIDEVYGSVGLNCGSGWPANDANGTRIECNDRLEAYPTKGLDVHESHESARMKIGATDGTD
ncbi:hypothetical protein MFFC18_15580 [Mariniblastus fucicola]|uniref:Uncharacterized protein n=1 Tax=Mariniblastus fucicola TaxID=980251 RepID=A0A5B9P869_9BACT|nr:hypothetical protein MFFC18_15580 [Mariniblastus fucicola]